MRVNLEDPTDTDSFLGQAEALEGTCSNWKFSFEPEFQATYQHQLVSPRILISKFDKLRMCILCSRRHYYYFPSISFNLCSLLRITRITSARIVSFLAIKGRPSKSVSRLIAFPPFSFLLAVVYKSCIFLLLSLYLFLITLITR